MSIRTILVLAFIAGLLVTAPLAGAAVDSKSTQVLNSAFIAHKQVTEVKCTVKLREQQGTQSDSASVEFAFRKPDFAMATMMASGTVMMRCTSNGKQVLLYSPQDKQYLHQPIATGKSGASAIVTASQSKILKVFVRPQALINTMEGDGVDTKYTGTSTVDGQSVDLVSATLPAREGSTLTVTCGFGRRDHILRSMAVVTKDSAGNENRIDEVVSHLSLSPGLTSADFPVSTPKNATQIKPEADNGYYDSRLKPGATPIPIDAVDTSGRKVSLSQYRGKVLLVDFWATWCGPCMMEMPNVQAVYKKYHSRGLEVVGYNQDHDESHMKLVLAERGFSWREVFCGAPGGEAVPIAYGIQAIPFMMLVGRDGKIAAVDMRGPELEAAVAAAIAK